MYKKILLLIVLAFGVFWMSINTKSYAMPNVENAFTNVSFVSENNDNLRLTKFRGKIIVLFFGYAHCPDICPTTLLDISKAITELGKDVDEFYLGDRVAYVGLPIGAYSEQRNYPANGLVKIPENVSDDLAAASMLKGLTAWYLANKSYPIQIGNDVLIYAAAGGVGLIACQWAKALGVKLIGTVSSPEKAKLAMDNGAWATINYKEENIVERVRGEKAR